MKNILKVLSVLCLLISTTPLFSQSTDDIEYEFLVQGLCGMCEDRIESVALSKPGVKSADWDFNTMLLKVVLDESLTPISHVKYAISLAGHDNGNFIASQDVYDNLPACCQYREETKVEFHSGYHPIF